MKVEDLAKEHEALLRAQDAIATRIADIQKSLAAEYGRRLNASLAHRQQRTGRARVDDGLVTVERVTGQRTTWDQKRLAKAAARLGDKAEGIVQVSYKIGAETYDAISAADMDPVTKDLIIGARMLTTSPGKISIRLNQ